jgi:hypothetical protein
VTSRQEKMVVRSGNKLNKVRKELGLSTNREIKSFEGGH